MSQLYVIGIGNMGSALVSGLCKTKLGFHKKINIFDPDPDKTKIFKNQSNINILKNINSLSIKDSIVLFCVKPHDLKEVTKQFSISQNSLVISILAGKELVTLEKEINHGGAIVRAMPNIAAMVGFAATAMSHNQNISPEQIESTEDIFNSIGECHWVKENLMDAITGLSGSGPAYIYMVIEALIDGGVNVGLPRTLASRLAIQTVLGASNLVKESGLHPAILKDQVTTPAGTTIAALHELEKNGLRSMFVSAVTKATEKSKQLRSK